MLKSKTGWLLTAVALAVGLGLPPAAQGSELAKLGRLIVTGKRSPSAEVGKAGALPALPAVEPRAKAQEPERAAAPHRSMEPGGIEPSEGVGERGHETPVPPRGGSVQPATETPSPRTDRVGRLAQPSANTA